MNCHEHYQVDRYANRFYWPKFPWARLYTEFQGKDDEEDEEMTKVAELEL